MSYGHSPNCAELKMPPKKFIPPTDAAKSNAWNEDPNKFPGFAALWGYWTIRWSSTSFLGKVKPWVFETVFLSFPDNGLKVSGKTSGGTQLDGTLSRDGRTLTGRYSHKKVGSVSTGTFAFTMSGSSKFSGPYTNDSKWGVSGNFEGRKGIESFPGNIHIWR